MSENHRRIGPNSERHRLQKLDGRSKEGRLCRDTQRHLAEVVAGIGRGLTVYGKGGKTRHVLLSSGTWDALTAIRDEAGDDAPVFVSRTGGPLSRTQAFRIVRAAAKRASVDKDVSPHWLRHAHASHALDRGAAVHLVQATLGHSSVATTGRYLHARPTESSSKARNTSPSECNVNLVMLHSARCEEVEFWFAWDLGP